MFPSSSGLVLTWVHYECRNPCQAETYHSPTTCYSDQMAQCMPWPKVTQWQCSSRSVSKKRPTRLLGKGNIPLFEWLRVSSIKSSDRVYFLVKRLVFRGGCVLSCASSCGMETEISYNYIALSSSTG